MHVLLLAETLPDAERLASSWRSAAPHADTEARAVPLPGPARRQVGGGAPAGPTGSGHADAGHADAPSGSASGGVLLAGAAIPVGPPTGVGSTDVGPAAPGPTPPGPAQSALPQPDAAALRAAAAHADVVVAFVTLLDGEELHRGVVVEAAAASAPHAVPVVVVTARSEVTRREWSTAGLSGVHEVPDGDVARVARTWSPQWAR